MKPKNNVAPMLPQCCPNFNASVFHCSPSSPLRPVVLILLPISHDMLTRDVSSIALFMLVTFFLMLVILFDVSQPFLMLVVNISMTFSNDKYDDNHDDNGDEVSKDGADDNVDDKSAMNHQP